MMQLAEYVRQRESEYFAGSTRVTLRSIVADWQRGRTPEQVAADFPSVSLVTVYGAITTYLERQQEFDRHFAEVDATVAEEKAATEAAHSEFYTQMRARVAQVRPRVQAELRAHGILSEGHVETEDADGCSNTGTSSVETSGA